MSLVPFKFKQVETELRAGVERDIDDIFRNIKRDLSRTVRTLYLLTVQFWNGTYHHGLYPENGVEPPSAKDWLRPYPEVKIDIRITKDWDVVIEVKSSMMDGAGKTHDLWYWLDRGVSFTQTTVSPPIPNQVEKRYPGDSLSPNPSAGYDDSRWRVVQPGTPVEKAGKNWSEQIGKEVQLQFPEWRVNWEIN